MEDKKIWSWVEIITIIFLAIFVIFIIPGIVFLIVNCNMNSSIFKSNFLGDNVLVFYGTIIGACFSGFITATGLYITLKENNKNLNQQKKMLENDFKKQLAIKRYEENRKTITKTLEIINDTKVNLLFVTFDENNSIEFNKVIKEIFLNFHLFSDYNNRISNIARKNSQQMLDENFKEIKNMYSCFTDEYQNLINGKENNFQYLSKEYSKIYHKYYFTLLGISKELEEDFNQL